MPASAPAIYGESMPPLLSSEPRIPCDAVGQGGPNASSAWRHDTPLLRGATFREPALE